LLQPGEISELIVDTDSYEVGVSSDISSVEGGSESVRGCLVPVILTFFVKRAKI